jgi:hypothetical protein
MLAIVRGLPGTNKTKVAQAIAKENGGAKVITPNDFMLGLDGTYELRPRQIDSCFKLCLETVEFFLRDSNVVVHGCFPKRTELETLTALGSSRGHAVHVYDLYDGQMTDEKLAENSSRGIPLDTIKEIRESWER